MLGSGILKGLAQTARNLVGSYCKPEERLVTVQYPEQKVELKENFRSIPFLVYDGDDPEKGLRCTACKICEKECPPQCIFIVPERDANGKLTKHPQVFDVDVAICMNCGICAEVCPFDSIKMDSVYELTADDRFAGLIHHKEQLAKSNEYYHSVKPAEAAEVDARLAEEQRKAEEAAKAKAAKAAAAAAAKAAEAKGAKPAAGTSPEATAS
jgi:NADH-quinone oxidoreductase subunit I